MTSRLYWADEVAGDLPEGAYELLRPLAVGTIGEIDLARAHGVAGFIKPVAIKRLRPELAADPRFRDILVRDTKLAVRLRQPSIVPVLDLGRDREEMYVAMEFIAGVDVGAWLDTRAEQELGPLPPPLAAHVAHRVLEAVESAHDIGLTHGDVRAHRVIISVDGEVKLGGFGLSGCARYVDSGASDPVPESVDLEDVAKLLYEMLTALPSVDPSTLAYDAPLSEDEDLDAFLRQALLPTPARRFSSATAMRASISACLADMIYVGSREVRESLQNDASTRVEAARRCLRDASLAGRSKDGNADEELSTLVRTR